MEGEIGRVPEDQLGSFADWMSKPNYLARIAIARSQKSSRSSADAYAQVDRMAKSMSGASTTKASVESSPEPKSADATTKGSNR